MTYAQHAESYVAAGWTCVLPVPAATKTPPPAGFTGAAGRDTTPLDVVGWVGTHPGSSIALRMPDGVLGIDVDDYAKGSAVKRGARTLAALEARLGTLPPTWSSTARGTTEGPGPSRIMLFRVPAGRYATVLRADVDGTVSGDIEVIQRHHRYAVVAPSPHPSVGAPYRWYAPDGTQVPVGVVPGPADLAELPAAWVAHLAAGAAGETPAAAPVEEGLVLLAQLEADTRPECAEMSQARLGALSRLSRADEGSRHDTATAQAYAVVQTAASGHPGGAAAIAGIRAAWEAVTDGEDRADEIERILRTAAQKAATRVGTSQVGADPCLLALSHAEPAPRAQLDAGGEAEAEDAALADDRPIHPLGWIGTEAFDPSALLDQPLAAAALQRLWPMQRYAYDARTWLLRGPTRWELRKASRPQELAQTGVALLADLAPRGDSGAEKGTDDAARAQRYARLNSSAGSRGIAGKMVDLVAGGAHPCALRLSDLDAEPTLLWAGGVAYELRKARADREIAQWVAGVPEQTPHLHSAAVAPADVPTPRWDAFLAAVWPDPEVRAWALRVLSVCLTGYSDRVLPILLGEAGRGKTATMVLIMSVLGTYAHAADPKLLSTAAEKTATGAILFALKGRRCSFIDEGPREGRFAQERLKQLTGGGELTADDKYASPVTFRPTHTLVMTANDDPILIDPALRARVRILPCDQADAALVATTRAVIGQLRGAAWRAEAPGVLRQLMIEAGGYLRDPSTASQDAAPESIRWHAERIARDQDPVLSWLAEDTEPYDEGTPSRELYADFVAACRRGNLRGDLIPSETSWGLTLRREGYPSKHTEWGKTRPLRLRGNAWGGRAPAGAAPADGFGRSADGLLTGLEPNPSAVKPLESLMFPRFPDGLTGLGRPFTRDAGAPAPTHTHEDLPENQANPSAEAEIISAARGFTPDGLGSEPVSQPVSQPVAPSHTENEPVSRPEGPAYDRTATVANARQAKAEAGQRRAAARAEAVALASGPAYTLPAVVLRDQAIREISCDEAAVLLAIDELTVDVETTGYPVGHEHFALRTVQLGDARFAVVLDPVDPAQADVARTALAAASRLHAHSATADLVPLDQAGLLAGGADEAWSRMYDTVLPAKLADPASTGVDPGLKQLAPAVLGDAAVTPAADAARGALFRAGRWLTNVAAVTPPARSGWAQVDPRSATMIRYAGSDVLDTAALAARIPEPPAVVLDRERRVQAITARVTHQGLRIDAEHTAALLAEHTAAADAAQAAVREVTGVDNVGSNDQLGRALTTAGARLPLTVTGKPSVTAAVLDRLAAADGPAAQIAATILEYRHHTKLVTTYLEPYLEQVEHGDGRIRPTIYTLAADTGRMSAARPNVQQVPRSGGVRACITADPGELLVSADFSGVELRVAAALSGDAQLRAIMADPDRDLHWEVARLAFGPQATKSDRYAVKRGVFGRIYGAGVATIAASVGVSEATAEQIVAALDQLTPQLGAWSRHIREAVKAGMRQYPTYAGRVIHLDPELPHKAPNFCIQGTARELLVDALLRLEATPWGRCVVVPVHDEIVMRVPTDEADAATAALVSCMTSELAGVPIVPEPSEPSFAWRDSA